MLTMNHSTDCQVDNAHLDNVTQEGRHMRRKYYLFKIYSLRILQKLNATILEKIIRAEKVLDDGKKLARKMKGLD